MITVSCPKPLGSLGALALVSSSVVCVCAPTCVCVRACVLVQAMLAVLESEGQSRSSFKPVTHHQGKRHDGLHRHPHQNVLTRRPSVFCLVSPSRPTAPRSPPGSPRTCRTRTTRATARCWRCSRRRRRATWVGRRGGVSKRHSRQIHLNVHISVCFGVVCICVPRTLCCSKHWGVITHAMRDMPRSMCDGQCLGAQTPRSV